MTDAQDTGTGGEQPEADPDWFKQIVFDPKKGLGYVVPGSPSVGERAREGEQAEPSAGRGGESPGE